MYFPPAGQTLRLLGAGLTRAAINLELKVLSLFCPKECGGHTGECLRF